MISNNQTLSSFEQIDKVYFQFRQELITIIRLINSKLNFHSQTMFLSICYLDQIFSKPIIINSKQDYILYSMSCYLIASKYSENDPNIPDLSKYIKTLAEVTQYTYTLTIDELSKGELMALQYLDYKLNCFSIYHFVTYFFAHGIIFETEHNSIDKKRGVLKNTITINNQNKVYTKLLENIYIQSRELLDFIFEDQKYCIIGKDNVLGAIEILRKVIELNTLNEKKKDIFDHIYHIDQYINKQRLDSISKIIDKVYRIRTLKQQDDTSRPTGKGNENIKQIPEKDNHKIKTKAIQSPNKKIVLNLSKIKGATNYLSQQTKNNKLFTTNLFDSKQLSFKKRALSSNKDKDDKKTLVYVIKNKLTQNNYNKSQIPFNKEHQLDQFNIPADPLFQQYNTKPVKSIRIKKDLIANEQDEATSGNILANSTKNAIKGIQYGYPPNPKKEHQQQDILDMTKKIFEQSKRNKMDQRDNYYSSNDVNKYKIQSQTINDSLNQQPSYNTIIINNNININTFIQKKDTFDSKTHNSNEKENCEVTHNKFNQYQTSSFSIKSKGTGVNGKQNYFGTYFDYDNDSIINHNRQGDLFNSSEIKKIYNDYLV